MCHIMFVLFLILSYSYMEMIVSKWDELGVLKRVLEKKLIFIETKVWKRSRYRPPMVLCSLRCVLFQFEHRNDVTREMGI